MENQDEMYYFLSDPDCKVDCKCGNPSMGFDCSCKHIDGFPGDLHFTCNYCGMYFSSKPKCNKCEKSD